MPEKHVSGLATIVAICQWYLRIFVKFEPILEQYCDPSEIAALRAIRDAVAAFLALLPTPNP